MIEEQLPQEPEPIQEIEISKPNWKLWIAAGGCVVLLCAAVFVGTLIFAGPKFVQQFIPEKIQVADELLREFWTETEPQLIEEYVNTGKIFFEYRSMGAFLGPESGWAAEGAYCAGDQGKFWEYHDTLFTNWTGENVGDFTKDKLIKYAKALDLNMAEFESCISEEKHKGTVEQDKVQADADGVHATPTLFINGYRVEGAQPFDILKDLIEQALNGNLDTQSG